MPFRNAETHLRDILSSLELIETFLIGFNLEGYKGDLRTKSAVERQLQIITEAAYRLGDEADIVCPGRTGKVTWAWETF